MPGITDVAIIPHSKHVPGGVAVRGETFGQCIDAIRALSVDWAPGTAAGRSDATVLADLAKAELPMTPPVNLLAKTIDKKFTFHFRPGDPLETEQRRGRRATRPRRDLVEPEDADLGPGAARHSIWACR